MEFSFDIRGHLTPYGKNQIDHKQFKEGFVDPFDEDSSRHELYKGFIKYNNHLKDLLNNQKYIQWVDGSFISRKINPRDIDLVSLVDNALVEKYETELAKFVQKKSKLSYGIDGFIVRVYPQDHPKYVRTKTDLIYWENWFSMSRKNRRKQRFPKGFIELQF